MLSKNRICSAALVLATVCGLAVSTRVPAQAATATGQPPEATETHIQRSASRGSRDVPTDEMQARSWGLDPQEFARYRELMQGPLGVYSPNLDPLTALGIEARSSAEQRHYAEAQVRAEARRVEKLLAYQRAYDAAWNRLYPSLQPVERLSIEDPRSGTHLSTADSRTAVFVKENCAACDARVKELEANGRPFDIYFVGSRQEDARIRSWATRIGLDPAKVRARVITLNHDEGRWLAIGGQGELPAVMRQVEGRWERE
jgi:integrating conjugative element protein (TIGR03759 family)